MIGVDRVIVEAIKNAIFFLFLLIFHFIIFPRFFKDNLTIHCTKSWIF